MIARLLAPLALIVFLVAFVAILLGSGVIGDDTGTNSGSTSDLPAATERTTTEQKQKKTPKTYTIKTNDTLSGIAAKTGTTVATLQELNPELDPTGLVAGQKIKLRE
ncbi:MAG: LysM domain [Thermoleophilaceae bacterium]|nr:LysM domain [Thermoleophilaceae bacterium]MEA2407791.1 LysM domain [Thermoleophilaceae bacterium]